MRVKKLSALALVVTAASLSLTACGGGAGSGAASGTNASTAAQGSAGDGSSASDAASGSADGSGSTSGSDSAPASGSGTGSGSGSSGSASGSSGSSSGSRTGGGATTTRAGGKGSGARCKTDNLGFSAASAMVKNEIVVNLKNNGPSACSMHGFPGVQLVGPDGLGDTGPDAARTDTTASTVTIAPGEETRFLLHYIPATGSSRKTYTRLSVTPPNETVSSIVNLGGLDITVAAPDGEAPDVYVDPVGYHVGSGK
ncbi:DUF4232 domain-containing protein [Streptomyces sp. NRRL S-340]|uniref:DUF4232 domain-containing protein n=1 Tax=Streptomyces sp. NRRL S-340 TaxID=1463901 RepID=UPI000569A6DE|nr:DUF4232 domain-containing protein [Streptomyces sp. NRRL S-340]